MSGEGKDLVWNGKKYREHVAEILKVVRPSTAEEIDRFGETFERLASDPRRAAAAGTGEFRAVIFSDSGEATDYGAERFADLWGKVRTHLLNPESRWLRFEITWPKFSSTVENLARNVKRITLSEDGRGRLVSEAIPCPIPPGESIPAKNPDRLRDWLASLAEVLAMPLPAESPEGTEHPATVPALRLRGQVGKALDLILRTGADSPEAQALELGVLIATGAAEIQAIERAPVTLGNPHRKRPRAGAQRHEKKTGRTAYLRDEIRRILREYGDAGNPLKPSEVLRRLKRTCQVTGDSIRHPQDAEPITVSHLRKTVIPAIRKEILGE
jgi:hypothetical protein